MKYIKCGIRRATTWKKTYTWSIGSDCSIQSIIYSGLPEGRTDLK